MLGHLFPAHVDGAEGVGQILPAGGIQVGGRLIEEGDPGADGLQQARRRATTALMVWPPESWSSVRSRSSPSCMSRSTIW